MTSGSLLAGAMPQAGERAVALRRAAPGVVVAAFGAALCMTVGWYWDISWHRSIGRDTPLTAPHLAIYASLVISFACSALLVLSFTFGRNRSQPAVRVLGFRGPAGAFLTLWGLSFQGTAIVFDLWWHDAYGLDLGIFSPPHYAIMIGSSVLFSGLFLLVMRHANALRAEGRGTAARRLVVGFAALGLVSQLLGLDPVYGPAAHASIAMVVSACIAVPFMHALVDEASGSRWASAAASLLYAAHVVAVMQVFQLFPATPQFGPVYVDPERFLPPPFPLPLVIPAIVLALAFPVLDRRLIGPLRTLAHGMLFAVVLAVACRAQAALLASPWGDNRFFAGHAPPSAFQPAYLHVEMVGLDPRSVVSVLAAGLVAAGTAWLGRRAGRWVLGVVR